MTKSAVVRQYFMDLIETLEEDNCTDAEIDDYKREENMMTVTNLFFSGHLELKWNPKKQKMMMKTHPEEHNQEINGSVSYYTPHG